MWTIHDQTERKRQSLDDPAFKGNPNMNTQTDKNAKVFKVGGSGIGSTSST